MIFSILKLGNIVALLSLLDGMQVAAQPTTDVEKKTLDIRGVISAGAEAEISSPLAAKLISMPFEMGETFKKGDTIAVFDCRRGKAEYAALKATQKALALAKKRDVELFENGAAGALEVETSTADYQRATADLTAKAVDLKECVIFAPYDGSVAARFVDPYETPSPGSPLLKIIDDQALEIKLIAPSNWLRWLKVGEAFTFDIDETGARYNAKIIRMSTIADPVSQTIDLDAQFTEETPHALSGMSGHAKFTPPGDI